MTNPLLAPYLICGVAAFGMLIVLCLGHALIHAVPVHKEHTMYRKHLIPHRRPLLPLLLACLGMVLMSLAAFTPASTSPTVWVAADATAAMHCMTHTTTTLPTAHIVVAAHPCAAGTITDLVPVAQRTAVARHQAYVTTPTGPAAQALLHPAASTPAVAQPAAGVCPSIVGAACGGGGGDSSPCAQQSKWLSFGTGNVSVQGWYSSAGTSDCRAFEVYSEGLEQTWSRPLWAWFSWHTVWQSDNGYSLNDTLPTSYYLTRSPYYWVGPGGAREDFYENNGFATNYFAVQFTPR